MIGEDRFPRIYIILSTTLESEKLGVFRKLNRRFIQGHSFFLSVNVSPLTEVDRNEESFLILHTAYFLFPAAVRSTLR